MVLKQLKRHSGLKTIDIRLNSFALPALPALPAVPALAALAALPACRIYV